MRLLRMHDRPRLVKAVDERPRRQRRAPLLEGAPDPDEPVAQREDGLRPLEKLLRVPRLYHPPLVGRVQMLRRHDNLTLEHDPTILPHPGDEQIMNGPRRPGTAAKPVMARAE